MHSYHEILGLMKTMSVLMHTDEDTLLQKLHERITLKTADWLKQVKQTNNSKRELFMYVVMMKKKDYLEVIH